MKRLALVLLFLAVLGVTGCVVWWVRWEPPVSRPDIAVEPGTLTLGDRVDATTHTLGDFVFTLTGDAAPQLTLTHRRRPDAPLFQNPAGENFLAAAQGTEHVTETRGSFFIQDDVTSVQTRQRLLNIQYVSNVLTLSGDFEGSDGASLGWSVHISPDGPGRLTFVARVEDETYDRLYLNLASTPEEQFFGFGEQFSFANMKGRLVPVFVSEQGVGRGAQPLTKIVDIVAQSGGAWHTTYAGTPWFLTNRQRGFYLENTEYSAFDLRDADRVTVQCLSPTLTGAFVSGDEPKELLVHYTEASGRMRALPEWILDGAIVGMQGGTEKVRRVWQQLQDHDVPLAGFWLQDWVGQRTTSVGRQLWWNWELDADHYPEWETLVADLNAAGVEVMTYVNPFLADVSEKENVGKHLYEEAREKGYLVTDEDGEPYEVTITSFDAGLVDLTNPEAYAWLQGIVRERLVGSGAKGWMADFGEALPYDGQLHSADAATFHNEYPVAWAKLNREVVDALHNGDDYVFFMRSGFRRSPAYATLFWEGDQMVTWDEHDGIKSAVTGLLTGGMSGFTLNHSDIGGYTSISRGAIDVTRSRELLMRWMELSALTTVFRTHEGITPDENAQVYDDPELLDHFARCAKLYNAWGFLRKSRVKEAAASGIPVARHPFLLYPDDPEVADLTYEEFFLGDHVLVAPVLDAGAVTKRVYLPQGRWRHVWTNEIMGDAGSGMWVEVDAPSGKPPVFVPETSYVGDQFRANLVAAGLLDGPAPAVFNPPPISQAPAPMRTPPPLAMPRQTPPPFALP
jgi:alpha-glucosidase